MAIGTDPGAASAVTLPDLALHFGRNVMRVRRRLDCRSRFVGLGRTTFFLLLEEEVGHGFEHSLPCPTGVRMAGELACPTHLRHDAIGKPRTHEPIVGGNGLESDAP